MKLLILALFAVAALAEENFNGFEYAPIDWSSALPVEDFPGFWEKRDLPLNIPTVNVRDRRIVNGVEVERNSHPYQVALSLMMPDGRIGLCGGSVLGVTTVLTAGEENFGNKRP